MAKKIIKPRFVSQNHGNESQASQGVYCIFNMAGNYYTWR